MHLATQDAHLLNFVIENGGCWKEGHKAADLGILAWRFSNENGGDRRLGQNKVNKTLFKLDTFCRNLIYSTLTNTFEKVLWKIEK